MSTCGPGMLLALCIALFLPVVRPQVGETISSNDVGVNTIASSSGRPFYRILNSVGEDLYIGGNETLIKLYVNGDDVGMNHVGMNQTTLVTEEAHSVVNCADRFGAKSDVMCWNYIRIAENISSEELLVCGSNAYSRRCYRCPQNTQNAEDCTLVTLPEDNSLIPASPTTVPVAAVYSSPSGNVLYGGNVAENTFQRLTLQNFLTTTPTITPDLETVTDQTGFIKAPAFVGKPYEDPNSNYLFVFYREIAVEYERHGVKEYPRIARVCKNDTGGTLNTGKFLTFVKARLNCSIPDILIPFYFDEIQDVVWNDIGNETYAVFTSHVLGPKASALCRFRKEDIMNLFDDGDSKLQEGNDVNRLWLPAQVKPRPGTCADHTTDYPPLMDKLVPNWNPDAPNPDRNDNEFQEAPPTDLPISRAPLFYLSGVRFTSLAIDFDFNTPIYFFGTSAGTVIKAFKDGDSYKHIEINDFEANNSPVSGVKLLRNAENSVKYLVITTEYNVITWSLTGNCAAQSSNECRILRYPYCSLTANRTQCVCDNSDNNCKTATIDDPVLVQPAMDKVKSCDNLDVYLYCQLQDNMVQPYTLSWERDGDEEFINKTGHLVKVNRLSAKLVELKITTHNSTAGMYNCIVKMGDTVVLRKQVNLEQESCLTEKSLQLRCDEYEELKKEQTNLAGRDTCDVYARDCDTCRLGVVDPSK